MNDPRVRVTIVEGPLPSPAALPVVAGAGAVLTFEGVVRPTEGEAAIAALDYSAYEPMTTREMTRLAEQALATHGLLAIAVEHSVGRVAAGETSFRLSIASRHRKEALAAAAEFIDAMKRDVPLWKMPVEQTSPPQGAGFSYP